MSYTPRKSRPDYPDGVLGIYDNGGTREGSRHGTFDRYTVVFDPEGEGRDRVFPYLAMSAHPFHPQGFGQHGEARHRVTRGPGERCIDFEELPEDCQRAVRQDLDALTPGAPR